MESLKATEFKAWVGESQLPIDHEHSRFMSETDIAARVPDSDVLIRHVQPHSLKEKVPAPGRVRGLSFKA